MTSVRMRGGFLGALLLFSAACADDPIGPSAVQSPPPATLARVAEDPGHVTATCYARRRSSAAPATWQGRMASVELPRSTAALDGALREYRYQGFVSGGEMVATASCVIPSTERAVRHMDRLFGAKRAAASGDLGGVTIMGCVTNDFCEVDGVTINACIGGGDWPDCNGIMKPEDIPQCATFGECGDDGGWDPSAGPDSSGGPGGFAAFVVCVAAALGPEGWTALGGTALAGYALWKGANDVAAAKAKYEEYRTIYGYPTWDANVEELYRLRYEDAQSAQTLLWATLAAGSGASAWFLGKAVHTCAPALAVPV